MRCEVRGTETYAYTGSRPLVASQPSVLFVHGAANDHMVWALQSRWFAHHGWNSVAVDLPGHGRSAGEPLPSVEALAAWIVELLDALGIDRAALAGHSMGSLAVLETAARSPERVAKIALLGPSVPMPVSEALLAAARAQDHAAYEMINGWAFAPSKQLGGNRNPGLWLLGNWMRLMERSRPGALHTDLAACNAYRGGLDAAARVACPALVVLGAQDLMVPARNARALAQALRAAQVVTIPDCGHVLMAEQPDAVLDALRRFLADGAT
jgi:pimeloyl-ACP methyl ester carboxylesterase